jgi:RNA polymerase sigma-70 factor (ECF subfamily)
MRTPARPADPDALLQHAGFIRGVARGLLVDAVSADDVVQETWLAALRHPPAAGANLRAWLAVVARNLASRVRRSAKRRARHEPRGARPDRLPSAAELAARIEIQRRVLDAVERLDEPYRGTLLYRYFDGLLPKEIAERLGVPVKTVKSRLHRALRTLRADLGRTYGGDHTKWSALLLPFAWPTTPGGGGFAAAGGIVIAMKKWAAALAFLLCLLATTYVVRETARGTETAARSAPAPDRDSPVHEATADAAPAAAAAPQVLRENDPLPAFTFAGRVVDAEGRGVGDAELRLVYWLPGKGEIGDSEDKVVRRARERRERPATSTDQDGYFRLDRPYASKSHLVVRAEGFAPTVAEPCEPGVFLLIRLARTPPLSVTAVRTDEQPVADAAVRLVTSHLGQSKRVVLAEAATDAQGIAQLPAAQAPELWVEVDPKDPALAPSGSRVAPLQESVLVKLPSLPTKTVRIVDGRTGAPVPGALVIACRGAFLDTEERRRFPADADGHVQVPWSIQEHRFATAPGYETMPVVAELVQLFPAMRIEGRVLDGQGRPVPDAAILLAIPPGGLFASARVGMGAVAAWSDVDGRFVLDDVTVREGRPDDGVRSVIALHPDHALAFADGVVIEPGGRAAVELRFTAPAALDLEVIDTAGAPMGQQWVRVSRLMPLASGKLDDRRDAGVNVVALVHGQHTLVTDDRGRAEAARLPPGRYVVRSEETTAEAELVAGAATKLKLVKGAGMKLLGRVLRADGTPAAGVWVGVPGAPALGGRQTDADGRFQFVDVPDFRLADVRGGHKVQIVLPDWRGHLEVPAKLGEDLTITLPAAPAKLKIETNLPPDAQVFYVLGTETGARVPESNWASRVGPFETEAFTPGRGLLVAQARGRGMAEVEFEAPAGRTTVVSISFPEPGSVEGAVGVREAGVRRWVKLTRAATAARGGDDLRRRLTDVLPDLSPGAGIGPEGVFRIDAVAPGSYRVALFEVNREVAARDIEVRSGETLAVSFEAK